MPEGRGNPARAERTPPRTTQAGESIAPHSIAASQLQDLVVRCTRELRRRALLLDPERISELCALRIAASGGPEAAKYANPVAGAKLGATALSGEDPAPPEDWILRRIEAAIEQARREDRDLAQKDPGSEDAQDYQFLIDVFFVRPGEGARAAHAFNQLPRSTRRATFELLLHARPIKDCLAEGLAEDPQSLADKAREGLLAIMQIDEAMLLQKERRSPRKRKGTEP